MSIEGGNYYDVPSQASDAPRPPSGESLASDNGVRGIQALAPRDDGTSYDALAPKGSKSVVSESRVAAMDIDDGSIDVPATSSEAEVTSPDTVSEQDADRPMVTVILDQRAIAVGDMSNPKDWEEKILSKIDFKGNVQTAAVLMTRFVAPRKEFEEMLEGAGSDLAMPQVSIFRQEDQLPENVGVIFQDSIPTAGGMVHEVMVMQSFLESISGDTPDKLFEFPMGAAVVTAPVGDYMELTGVEEHHHAIFVQVQPDYKTADYNPDLWKKDAAIAAYHAVDVEWQALDHKLDYAERKGITGTLVENYKDIREGAARIRESRGLPTHRVDLLTQQPVEGKSD